MYILCIIIAIRITHALIQIQLYQTQLVFDVTSTYAIQGNFVLLIRLTTSNVIIDHKTCTRIYIECFLHRMQQIVIESKDTMDHEKRN